MKKIYRVGIISDTHGLLRTEVLDILEHCDAIIHGGDIDTEQALAKLRSLVPLYIVRGNCDSGRWAEDLPDWLTFSIEGVSFFLIHDRQQIWTKLTDQEVVICGHSHQYDYREEDGRVWFNPGSCGKGRFGLPLTMAVMEITDGSYTIERIELSI